MPRMSPALALCAVLSVAVPAVAPVHAADVAVTPLPAAEVQRLQAAAKRVTILRDKWGIPHVYGKTDADAVFGMLYAQAEDDFNRVERNFITALGRTAEVDGEKALYEDLRMKLFIRPDELQAQYKASPAWLKKLMVAWADGLNWYLHTHPDVKPALLTHFEPWMALSFSEGSIGGDIEEIDVKQLQRFYENLPQMADEGERRRVAAMREPGGSNGFAIAPSLSRSGRALLMINPHTSFYFRPEIHVSSEQGLNAYGAVTWGQFFVYQGFNDRLGWMHTSGGGDVIDEFVETVTERDGKYYYRYGAEERPVRAVRIRLPYRTGLGMAEKTVTAYFTHHGPVVRREGGKWVSVALMNDPLKALQQSFLRTKARNYKAFWQAMELRTNSSNNTVYADADGNIAYFHGNFIPVRDPRFDYTQPVDGSDPATDWKGLHAVKETIHLFNPKNGWIQNTNNWPFSAAGESSPRAQDYPAYMSMNPENARGIHAVRVLKDKKDFTLDSLIASAYDSQLTAFEPLLPLLLRAYDDAPAGDVRKARLTEQITLLRDWDMRYALKSVPTSLAIYWLQHLVKVHGPAAQEQHIPVLDYLATQVTPRQRLEALVQASNRLENDFGTWKTPWGDINRFQRLTGDIKQPFDDSKPSIPVPYASGNWGSLAAFGMTSPQTTRRIYGERGNSFVAAVEFGPRIRAKSILAGGQSGNPASPHFMDQAEMYARGEFKDVLFYKDDVLKNLERQYRPGE
ncbi:penicillin acylase family protein [Pseudoduganella plicata]|uniref:Acylase n=1 Tax=Pseudoduganella plicata TaxID=321984 RepID=A0A4P7BA52_9BURK|nr:penicillin acylase family protein [Pseudoduganella plicata]QBQ34950.1 acylase [Pseudoduganella plicata]GGZ06214.1 penicillin amidase [Pseudoduganella plicata]